MTASMKSWKNAIIKPHQTMKLTQKTILTALFLGFTSLSFAQNNSIVLNFKNVVGNEALVLNEKLYTNASGEQFKISLLQYYISNIKLKRADGTEYVVPQDESYFLIREQNPASQTITLPNVPAGKYVGITFITGVDSLRNTMSVGRRTGCLDVGGEGKDMYWAWNSGYIFVKMEGTSPQIPEDSLRKGHHFLYHIGLFGGMKSPTLNNIRTTTLTFEKPLKVKENGSISEIQLQADVLSLFNGSTNISLAQRPVVMANPFSQKVADNYAKMFSLKGIKKLKASEKSAEMVGMK